MDIEAEAKAFISEWLVEHDLLPEDVEGQFSKAFPWIELVDLMKDKGLLDQVRKHVHPDVSNRFIISLATYELAERYIEFIDKNLEDALQVIEVTEAT